MFSFKVTSWCQFENQEYLNGTYLWIIHADKIPPHIGISNDGIYFSLKVSGKDDAVSINSLVGVVAAKQIPTLAIEVMDEELTASKLKSIFNQYERAESNVSSCLTPVSQLYFPKQEDLILSELLDAFREKKLLGNVYGMNLKSSFQGIPTYGRSEITNRIMDLENVKRR